jgi:hypothetical protein
MTVSVDYEDLLWSSMSGGSEQGSTVMTSRTAVHVWVQDMGISTQHLVKDYQRGGLQLPQLC